MTQINAFQCDICKNIYTKESKAAACLKDCKQIAAVDKRAATIKSKKDIIRNKPRLEAESLPHFIELMHEAMKELHNGKTFLAFDMDVSYSHDCSNSHSAPIGKKTNWCGQHKKEPRGYPGFTGSIRFMENPKIKMDTFESYFDQWRGIAGICTGGGGSCGDKEFDHRYYVTLWLDDLPIIKEKQERLLADEKKAVVEIEARKIKLNEAIATDPYVAQLESELEVLNKSWMEIDVKISEKRNERQALVDKTYGEDAIEEIGVITHRVSKLRYEIMEGEGMRK